MIRRVMLGTILIGMVINPLNAASPFWNGIAKIGRGIAQAGRAATKIEGVPLMAEGIKDVGRGAVSIVKQNPKKSACAGLAYMWFDNIGPVGDIKWELKYGPLGEEFEKEYHALITTVASTPTGKHLVKFPFLSLFEAPGDPVWWFKTPVKNIIAYSEKELEEDRITFFHGQAWGWNLMATATKKLYEQKHNTHVDDDFTFLRFFDYSTRSCADVTCDLMSGLCEKLNIHNKRQLSKREQEGLADKGVTNSWYTFTPWWEKKWYDERPHILFVNLALFANLWGSNTPHYVASNSDQSFGKRNFQELKDIFKRFGFKKEFEQITTQDPTLLNRFEELHNSASKYGNLVTISVPKKVASKIAYPSTLGGRKVNFVGMSDVTEIADNFEKMPFKNWYCISLGPNVLDPVAAKEAGIKIKSWNTADPKIIAQRDALIDETIAKCVALKSASTV